MSLSRQMLFLIPSALLFNYLWQMNGIWFCYPFAEILAVLVYLPFALRDYRRQFKYKAEQYATHTLGSEAADGTPQNNSNWLILREKIAVITVFKNAADKLMLAAFGFFIYIIVGFILFFSGSKLIELNLFFRFSCFVKVRYIFNVVFVYVEGVSYSCNTQYVFRYHY